MTCTKTVEVKFLLPNPRITLLGDISIEFVICVPGKISGVHHFRRDLCVCDRFMVHAGCVFVAVIHLCRTLMSGSFESACALRLDLCLYSDPRVWRN